MEWVFVIVVVVATGLALFLVARLRRARLQRRVRLEIANQGNVPGGYDLRAEEPQGALQFQFSLDGEALPLHGSSDGKRVAAHQAERKSGPPAPSKPQAKARGLRQGASQAMQTGGMVASLLTALGAILPRSIGAPLLQRAAAIRRVQIKASYAEQVPNQVSWIKSSAQRAVPGSRSPAASGRPAPGGDRAGGDTSGGDTSGGDTSAVGGSDGYTWARTPSVPAGETLAVDLRIRSLVAAANQQIAYQVVSRVAEQPGAPQVVQEATIHIRGGFWARRFLPSLLVVALALALLLLAYGLVHAGIVAW